jgi:hypothetical protein
MKGRQQQKTNYMKTIKKLLLLPVFVLLASQGSAQMLSGGLMAGVSSGAVKIDDIDNRFTQVIEGKNITGYEGGIFLRFKFGPFYIKPAAIYTFRSGEVTFEQIRAGISSPKTVEFKMHKVATPLLFGIKFLGPLSVEGGPVYNLLISATDDYSGNQLDFSGTGYGYRIGASADLGPFLLYLHYEGATFKSSGVNSATFKEPSKVVFGAGFTIGKK